MKPVYPQPRQDADNAAFLQGWRDGRLLIQRCRACARAVFYPRPMCPHCWSADLAEETASGQGTIASWSAIETPILLAEIALAEGATLLARIVDCPREAIASGAAVILPPRDIAARYPLPVFYLRPEVQT